MCHALTQDTEGCGRGVVEYFHDTVSLTLDHVAPVNPGDACEYPTVSGVEIPKFQCAGQGSWASTNRSCLSLVRRTDYSSAVVEPPNS